MFQGPEGTEDTVLTSCCDLSLSLVPGAAAAFVTVFAHGAKVRCRLRGGSTNGYIQDNPCQLAVYLETSGTLHSLS